MLDMVRSMMGFTTLPIFLWGYALEIACLVLNNILRKLVNKIPYEIWSGHRPNLSYFKVCRCLSYVKRLQTDKLGPKSDKYNFIGYPKEMRGFYFYLSAKQKVFVSNKAYFLEKKFLSEGISVSKIEFDEIRQIEELTPMIEFESNLI